jgi:hypothetical protein
MRGLDPRIQATGTIACCGLDRRVKPGDDGEPAMAKNSRIWLF